MNIYILYMNIFILLSIIYNLNVAYSISAFRSENLRNTLLRIIVFKEKKMPKLLNKIKDCYYVYYNKSIAVMGEGINEYNNKLSEEQKTIIETILSLCY